MAAPTGALVYRDALITIDDDDYANQLRVARLVPDQSVVSYKTLVPEGVVQDFDLPVWTLEIEGLQINATGGLSKALRTAQGTTVEVVLQPKSGFSQPMATFDVTVPAIPFGGEQGSYLDMTVTLPVQGQPVFGTSAAS